MVSILILDKYNGQVSGFECPKSIMNYEKKNTWKVRCLVDESFVPSAQRASVLYCRLSDFKNRAHFVCLRSTMGSAVKVDKGQKISEADFVCFAEEM